MHDYSLNLAPLANLKFLHLMDPTKKVVANVPKGVEKIQITSSNHLKHIAEVCTEFDKLNLVRFEILITQKAKKVCMHYLPSYLEELSKCTSLRELKVEFMDKAVLPHYAKFTQIRVLDLVHGEQNFIIKNDKNPPASHEDILELSKQIPNAKISFGFNSLYTLQRPKDEHWYFLFLMENDFKRYICYCGGCEMERFYEFDEVSYDWRSTKCTGPKTPTRSVWY